MISDDTILDFAKKCDLISPDCDAILHQGDLKKFAQLCFEEGSNKPETSLLIFRDITKVFSSEPNHLVMEIWKYNDIVGRLKNSSGKLLITYLDFDKLSSEDYITIGNKLKELEK